MPRKTEAKETAPGIGGMDIKDEAMQDVAALQALGLRSVTGLGTQWSEVLNDMGSEVLAFVASRVREDVKTQHKMLHCKDMVELQAIQTEFVRTAIEQYTAETGKLVEMSQQLFPAVPGTKHTPV